MLFFRKKAPENVEKTFSERLLRLESRLSVLEADILDLATAQNILRNKVLKKIQFKNIKEEEETSKDLYSEILIKEK